MPRKEDLKNWKIKECFISDRDGWCNYCHRTWKEGHKIYWMKKVDGNQTSYAACTDKKCYQEQGGIITPIERKKKDTPKNIGLDEFHWPSIEVEVPPLEAKLPGQVQPQKKFRSMTITFNDVSWAERDFLHQLFDSVHINWAEEYVG